MPLQQSFQSQQETINASPLEGNMLALEGQSDSDLSEFCWFLDKFNCKWLSLQHAAKCLLQKINNSYGSEWSYDQESPNTTIRPPISKLHAMEL